MTPDTIIKVARAQQILNARVCTETKMMQTRFCAWKRSYVRYLNTIIRSVCSATYVRWQRSTARIRPPLLEQSTSLLLCGRGPIVGQRDGRTDTVPFHRPRSAQYAGSATNIKRETMYGLPTTIRLGLCRVFVGVWHEQIVCYIVTVNSSSRRRVFKLNSKQTWAAW